MLVEAIGARFTILVDVRRCELPVKNRDKVHRYTVVLTIVDAMIYNASENMIEAERKKGFGNR